MSKVTVETVIDEERLREELKRSARSLPQQFPVIIEEFDEDNESPKVKTFTLNEIDKYVEIIQDFSRERFPEEVEHQAKLRAMRDAEESEEDPSSDYSPKRVDPTLPVSSVIEENIPKEKFTFKEYKPRRRTPPRTSTNRKGLHKRSRSWKHTWKRHNHVPFLKIPLDKIPIEQL